MGPKLCIMMAMCWIFLLVSLGQLILSPGSISSLPLARPPSRLRDWWSWRESERHLAGGGLGIWDGGLDRGLLACLSRPLGDWFPYISIQSLMLLRDFDRFWETQTLSGTPQTLSNSLKLSQNLSQTLSKPLKHKLNPAFWLVWGGFMVDISKKIQKNSKFSRNPFHHHRISLARVSGSAVLASRSSSNGSTIHPVGSGYLQTRQAKGTGNGVCWDGNWSFWFSSWIAVDLWIRRVLEDPRLSQFKFDFGSSG